MTGQSLLDYMEILFPEQQNQSGEADVTRSLLALNIAQDGFEALVAQEPKMLGGAVATLTTTANQEYSTYPAGLLRLDRLQYLDPATLRPAWNLDRIHQPGDQAYPLLWPGNVISTATGGRPLKYWENGSQIYWSPVPSGVYTIRYYGFTAAADITAGGTFAYPDIAAFPIASLAARIIKTGLDDNANDIEGLSKQFLTPTIDTMKKHNRDGAVPLQYRYVHRT